ncbi:MAG TPA: DUF3291 domain-containing protein, partial [Streptomyces sp.]|nr:DUF3291 domain-containing protein [Streptomyces sp.]
IGWDEAKRRVEERRRADDAAPGKAPA